MRSIYIALIGLFALTGSLYGQDLKEKEVPKAVVAAFKTRYPDAAGAEWKKNKSGKFEVKFKLSDKKAEAKFLTDGQWDSSELRVSAKDLPAAAAAYLKENYGDYAIDQIELKAKSDAAKDTYEVKLTKDKAETEVIFDKQGTFLKKKDKKPKSEA